MVVVTALLPRSLAAAPLRAAILTVGQSPAAVEFPTQLRLALTDDPALAPIASGDLSRALEAPLPPDPEQARRDAAAAKLSDARDAVARFDEPAALAALTAAEDAVLALRPGRQVAELLGDIEFARGQILFAQSNPAAAASFAAAQVLNPTRGALDPARFPPELIAAYTAARPADGEPGSVEVSAPFDGATIYLDGKPVAATPTTLRVAPGPHLLTVDLSEYAVASVRLDVEAKSSVVAPLRFERLPATERARRLRRELQAALHDGQINSAVLLDHARKVASYTGADAVVVVTDASDDTLFIQLYRSATDTLSAPVSTGNTPLEQLLAPLRPIISGPELPPPPPPKQPWWRSRFVQAGAIGGLVVGVVAVLASTLSGNDEINRVNASGPTWK